MAKIKFVEVEIINIIENALIGRKMFVLFISHWREKMLFEIPYIHSSLYFMKNFLAVRDYSIAIVTETCDRFGVPLKIMYIRPNN